MTSSMTSCPALLSTRTKANRPESSRHRTLCLDQQAHCYADWYRPAAHAGSEDSNLRETHTSFLSCLARLCSGYWSDLQGCHEGTAPRYDVPPVGGRRPLDSRTASSQPQRRAQRQSQGRPCWALRPPRHAALGRYAVIDCSNRLVAPAGHVLPSMPRVVKYM